MDKAYIHTSISLSVQVGELSVVGQLLFERMFPHADFQGRLPGHPLKVKSLLVPMIDISVAEVEGQLQRMHDLGLTIWYEAGGEKVIQLVSWWKYQPLRFAHPSKFPAPEGWRDRLRYNDPRNPKVLVEENWTAHVPVGRPKKSGADDPIQDAYIGDLHREPIQGAYEGGKIHPSASASASASASEDQRSTPFAPTPGNGNDPGSVQHPVSWSKAITWNKVEGCFEGITPEIIVKWKEAYPAVDLGSQLNRADEWIKANPTKVKKNYYKFLVNWMSRAQEKGGDASAASFGRGVN